MFLSKSNFSKCLISVASTVGLVTMGNFIFIDATHAFSVTFGNGDVDTFTNSGFENSTTGWSTIGDVTTNTGIDGVNPISGSNQAIITNSYKIEGNRDDDNSLTFNQSGTNPVDADTITTNHTGDDLQTFLGLGTNALSIDRNPAVSGFPRTSKEGSGMYQDITISISAADVTNGTNGFDVSFNWAYLTNDGQEDTYGLGNQDFSFVSIYDKASTPGAIQLLGDSDQAISAPAGSNDYVHPTTNYYSAGNLYSQSVTGLAEGTYNYRVGFAVVDVDSVDRSSALLIDDFTVQQVPFKFSPTTGIALVLGLIGCDQLRRRMKIKNQKLRINQV